jgi:hypothetical protein
MIILKILGVIALVIVVGLGALVYAIDKDYESGNNPFE